MLQQLFAAITAVCLSLVNRSLQLLKHIIPPTLPASIRLALPPAPISLAARFYPVADPPPSAVITGITSATATYGLPTQQSVLADYLGDTVTDLAVYNPDSQPCDTWCSPLMQIRIILVLVLAFLLLSTTVLVILTLLNSPSDSTAWDMLLQNVFGNYAVSDLSPESGAQDCLASSEAEAEVILPHVSLDALGSSYTGDTNAAVELPSQSDDTSCPGVADDPSVNTVVNTEVKTGACIVAPTSEDDGWSMDPQPAVNSNTGAPTNGDCGSPHPPSPPVDQVSPSCPMVSSSSANSTNQVLIGDLSSNLALVASASCMDRVEATIQSEPDEAFLYIPSKKTEPSTDDSWKADFLAACESDLAMSTELPDSNDDDLGRVSNTLACPATAMETSTTSVAEAASITVHGLDTIPAQASTATTRVHLPDKPDWAMAPPLSPYPSSVFQKRASRGPSPPSPTKPAACHSSDIGSSRTRWLSTTENEVSGPVDQSRASSGSDSPDATPSSRNEGVWSSRHAPRPDRSPDRYSATGGPPAYDSGSPSQLRPNTSAPVRKPNRRRTPKSKGNVTSTRTPIQSHSTEIRTPQPSVPPTRRLHISRRRGWEAEAGPSVSPTSPRPTIDLNPLSVDIRESPNHTSKMLCESETECTSFPRSEPSFSVETVPIAAAIQNAIPGSRSLSDPSNGQSTHRVIGDLEVTATNSSANIMGGLRRRVRSLPRSSQEFGDQISVALRRVRSNTHLDHYKRDVDQFVELQLGSDIDCSHRDGKRYREANTNMDCKGSVAKRGKWNISKMDRRKVFTTCRGVGKRS